MPIAVTAEDTDRWTGVARRSCTATALMLCEQIELGQTIEAFKLQIQRANGTRAPIHHGQSIGRKKLV